MKVPWIRTVMGNFIEKSVDIREQLKFAGQIKSCNRL